MKFLIISALLLIVVKASHQDQCSSQGADSVPKWIDLPEACRGKISNQIQSELEASMSYLVLHAHFNGDLNYRPGVAKFFLESAIEEREHAKKLIEYLLLRGGKIENQAIQTLVPKVNKVSSMKEALKVSLTVEKQVTDNIKEIIAVCEGEGSEKSGVNDYVSSDYFTGNFLTEQYASVRSLAGHLATLARMEEQYGKFGEIMFDKTFPLN